MDTALPGVIVKVDTAKRMAFGWAYVAQRADGTLPLDTGGVGTEPGHVDVVDDDAAVAAMEQAFYKYARQHRTADLDHAEFGVAELVEMVVFTPDKIEKMGLPAEGVPVGVWAGWRFPEGPEGDLALAKAKSKRALSVVGSGRRMPI